MFIREQPPEKQTSEKEKGAGKKEGRAFWEDENEGPAAS